MKTSVATSDARFWNRNRFQNDSILRWNRNQENQNRVESELELESENWLESELESRLLSYPGIGITHGSELCITACTGCNYSDDVTVK